MVPGEGFNRYRNILLNDKEQTMKRPRIGRTSLLIMHNETIVTSDEISLIADDSCQRVIKWSQTQDSSIFSVFSVQMNIRNVSKIMPEEL